MVHTHGQSSLHTLLGGLLKNRHLVAGMRRVMVMTLWEQVVGEMLAQKSWPEKMDEGALTIGVINHAWAEELHLHKTEILSRYRQLLGRGAVKEIVFHVTRRKPREHGEDQSEVVVLHPAPDETLSAAPPPPTVLAGITNPAVRDLLTPSFARLRAERDWKHQHGWTRCPHCQRIYHGDTCPHCGGQPEAA